MLRRSGFKPRKPPKHEPSAVEREPRPMAKLERSVSYAGTTGPAVPKGEKAKPGKRAPNVEEKRWLDAVVRFGCVACWLDRQPSRPTAVHHLLRGGVRMGHLHSIGLCDPGHHQNGAHLGLVSRHPTKAQFEQKYGTEAELLALLRAEIGDIA